MGFFPQFPGVPQLQNFHQNFGGIPSTSTPEQLLQMAHNQQLLSNPNFMGSYPRMNVPQPPPSYAHNLVRPQLPFGQQMNNEMTHKQG